MKITFASAYSGFAAKSFAHVSTSSRGANSDVITNNFPQCGSSKAKAAFSKEATPSRLGKSLTTQSYHARLRSKGKYSGKWVFPFSDAR